MIDKGIDATIFADNYQERLRGICVTLRRILGTCDSVWSVPLTTTLKSPMQTQIGDTVIPRMSSQSITSLNMEILTHSSLLSSLSTSPSSIIISRIEKLVTDLDSEITIMIKELIEMKEEFKILDKDRNTLQRALATTSAQKQKVEEELKEEKKRRTELESLVKHLGGKLEEHQKNLHTMQKLLG